jgi:hypothetical protein
VLSAITVKSWSVKDTMPPQVILSTVRWVVASNLENIFTFDGTPGHEIVQVYDGRLVDSGLYEQAVISGHEPGIDLPMKVTWKSLDEFGPGKFILYPDGLLELLRYKS